MECFVQILRGTVENDNLEILLTPDVVLNRYLNVIKDDTHKSALANLVNGLFEYGLWDKLIMFYPVLGDVKTCGVNLIDPSKYQIDTSGLSKTGENLIISDETKFQVPETNLVNLGKNDLTVFFALRTADNKCLFRLDDNKHAIFNFPYIYLYWSEYNNNMMFSVGYYSAAINNKAVSINKAYTDDVNSWNADVRVVQTIYNDKIYALRNGKEGINKSSDITDLPSFKVYPDFFSFPETLRTCGIGHGFTQEDCQHFDSLLAAFLSQTGKV